MNKFKWFVFNKLLDDIIIQDYPNLTKAYSLIYEKIYTKSNQYFIEDNEPTLDDYVLKCFERGNKDSKENISKN